MSKTVLLFPGQASQYVGMGADLYKESEAVRQLYELASDEIGEDIAFLSFEGEAQKLKRTRFTQPAILLHSLSVLIVLGDQLPPFDFAAGHSLGEYGALAVSGALSFEDAVKAVVKRAALMEDACVSNPGMMAAIIGLDLDKIGEICDRASESGIVIPANYNTKTQVVISGSPEGVTRAMELAKEAGAKRALQLEVGGAFHSPLMEPARQPLGEFLNKLTISDPAKPVVANVTARPVTVAADIKELLIKQVTSPVKWAQTMNYLSEQAVQTVIEIGPGKVLSGMAKREVRPQTLISLDTMTDIGNFRAVLAG